MTTEKEQLEQEFQKLINQRNALTKEIDRIWRINENDQTYSEELNVKQSELMRERFRLNKLIDENADTRREKGFIIVEL